MNESIRQQIERQTDKHTREIASAINLRFTSGDGNSVEIERDEWQWLRMWIERRWLDAAERRRQEQQR